MSFVGEVNEVIRLAGGYETRVQASAGKTVREMLTSHEPDPVEIYLSTLPTRDVFKIQTLMYLGCDGQEEDDIHEFHRAIAGMDLNRGHAIDTITSKLPVAEYLTDGLNRARELGLDLEVAF